MNKLLVKYLALMLLIFTLGCKETKPDSKQYNFENFVFSNDTCKVYSNTNYFYTCYGEFTNPVELQNYFSKQFSIKTEITFVYKDSSMVDTLYRIVKDNSFIKYVYVNSSEEKESMQIVSAMIKDPELIMTNGLKIGMQKSIALKMLFGKSYNSTFNKVNNYQVITALDGLWINLGFSNNKLNKIQIVSDYQVDQQ
jgi:hypothetical protein